VKVVYVYDIPILLARKIGSPGDWTYLYETCTLHDEMMNEECTGCVMSRWGGRVANALTFFGSWDQLYRELDEEGLDLVMLKTHRQSGLPALPSWLATLREARGALGYPLAPWWCPCGNDDGYDSLLDGSDDTGPILITPRP
jgi:hypothetical protein